MSANVGSDEVGIAAEAFQKLRLGFGFSIATVALFALSVIGAMNIFGLGSFLIVPVPALYFSAIYERASGWKLLGFGKTETVMWLTAIFLFFFPLSWIFVEFSSLSYPITVGIADLVPPTLWAVYTLVESHNIGELEKEFNLDLRCGRIFALCGILTFAAAYSLGLSLDIFHQAFFTLPFISIFFTSPFLILSSITLIRKLKIAGVDRATQSLCG